MSEPTADELLDHLLNPELNWDDGYERSVDFECLHARCKAGDLPGEWIVKLVERIAALEGQMNAELKEETAALEAERDRRWREAKAAHDRYGSRRGMAKEIAKLRAVVDGMRDYLKGPFTDGEDSITLAKVCSRFEALAATEAKALPKCGDEEAMMGGGRLAKDRRDAEACD